MFPLAFARPIARALATFSAIDTGKTTAAAAAALFMFARQYCEELHHDSLAAVERSCSTNTTAALTSGSGWSGSCARGHRARRVGLAGWSLVRLRLFGPRQLLAAGTAIDERRRVRPSYSSFSPSIISYERSEVAAAKIVLSIFEITAPLSFNTLDLTDDVSYYFPASRQFSVIEIVPLFSPTSNIGGSFYAARENWRTVDRSESDPATVVRAVVGDCRNVTFEIERAVTAAAATAATAVGLVDQRRCGGSLLCSVSLARERQSDDDDDEKTRVGLANVVERSR